MFGKERRQHPGIASPQELRRGLSQGQLATIRTMEAFGWTLSFVRRPIFQDPLPVLLNGDGTRRAVIAVDGTATESAEIRVRD